MFCFKRSSRKILLINSRSIISNGPIESSHYKVLGVTPKATQNDIKAAYYKLSMIYHPDKNKGSPEAAETFRKISAAYEVLGNLKTRRLYDKGILHSPGGAYPRYSHSEVTEEDDAQTRFYKAHMNKSKRPTPSGRTPIYDFDEWSRNHYSESFNRRKEAKQKYERKQNQIKRDKYNVQNEFVVFSVTIFIVAFLLMSQHSEKSSYDIVSSNKKKTDD